MTYAHSRLGSSTSDWQTLLDCYKVDERRECLMSHVSCHSSSSHVSRLNPLKFNPLFKSSLYMKYTIAMTPEVCYNVCRHDTEKALSIGSIKSCELKHVQGRSNPIIAHLKCVMIGESERTLRCKPLNQR